MSSYRNIAVLGHGKFTRSFTVVSIQLTQTCIRTHLSTFAKYKWTSAQHFLQNCMCVKRTLRSACASGQSDQRNLYVHQTKTQIDLRGPIRVFTGHSITNTSIQIYWIFHLEILIFFHISAQNFDCWYSLEPPRRGGSNGYTQSIFLSRNKKNKVYPCKPLFYYTKERFKGVKII